MVLAGRTKLRVSKSFFRGISFCICWISKQTQPQNQKKNIKTYSSILAIVNHRNWLDDSPPLNKIPARWSSGYAFVSGAGGLRFKSRAVQIRHNVPTGRHRCNISSRGFVLPVRNDAEMGSRKLTTRFGVIPQISWKIWFVISLCQDAEATNKYRTSVPYFVHVLLQLVIFMTKQKIFRQILEWIIIYS